MQEEVENRTLTLGINATKFSGRVLKAALCKYLAYRKEKKLQASRDSPDVKSFGKVSMEELQQEHGDMFRTRACGTLTVLPENTASATPSLRQKRAIFRFSSRLPMRRI